jgi:hypothetical protein
VALTHTRPFSQAALHESAWYWPIEPAIAALGVNEAFPTREQLTALHGRAASSAGVPALTFAPYVKRTRKERRKGPVDVDTLYDGSITARRQVPTRDADWHDLFNALVFASFPRSKHRLHARQYAQLRLRIGENVRKLPGARSREQDALTLFDEGGTFVAGGARLLELLRALEQPELYVALREGIAAGQLAVAPFGHALFEHKVAGLRGPSSFAYLLPLATLPKERAALVTALDAAFAEVLANPALFCTPAELRRLDLTDLGEPLVNF